VQFEACLTWLAISQLLSMPLTLNRRCWTRDSWIN